MDFKEQIVLRLPSLMQSLSEMQATGIVTSTANTQTGTSASFEHDPEQTVFGWDCVHPGNQGERFSYHPPGRHSLKKILAHFRRIA
ncbi:MAG TPA: hypothetical protein VKB93_28860 [Thermoanaerobaculia bacterium]|nr:hypothetical protein [Thermoanaerobaculia bacterium]